MRQRWTLLKSAIGAVAAANALGYQPADGSHDDDAPLAIPPLEVSVDPDNESTDALYPSVLDPMSPSLNYDTLEQARVYAYWIQSRDNAVVGAEDMAAILRTL